MFGDVVDKRTNRPKISFFKEVILYKKNLLAEKIRLSTKKNHIVYRVTKNSKIQIIYKNKVRVFYNI